MNNRLFILQSQTNPHFNVPLGITCRGTRPKSQFRSVQTYYLTVETQFTLQSTVGNYPSGYPTEKPIPVCAEEKINHLLNRAYGTTVPLIGGVGAKPPTGLRVRSTLLSPPSPEGEGGRGIGAEKNRLITLQPQTNPHCNVPLVKSGLPPVGNCQRRKHDVCAVAPEAKKLPNFFGRKLCSCA